MEAVGIIPARWASKRFPGKPLTPIAGRPMLEWVWRRARESKCLREVWVATDDERIREFCQSIGAPVVMTDADHETGTDRIAEVARDLDAEVVVNIQGDEPLIDPRAIDATVEALLQDPENRMATLAHRAPGTSSPTSSRTSSHDALHDPLRAPLYDSLRDPNRVKVVMDQRGYALYFSRAPIPHAGVSAGDAHHWLHVGLYAYRRELLLQYGDLPRGPAEQSEALEQLRALENGIPIRVAIVDDWGGVSVDVPADVARVEARLAEAAERDAGGR